MWPPEVVVAGRAMLRHVFECPTRLDGDGPCAECEAGLVFVSRLIPGYDPWSTAEGARFDYLTARRVVGFFHDHLAFIEGEVAGKPFDPEPWQAAVVVNVFGWLRPTGIRRYREFLLYVAAKNGKSPLLAGMALWLLLCDGEPGAQVFSAAAEKEQAGIIYRHASAMALQNPDLSSEIQAYRATKTLQAFGTNSFFRVLTSDADTKHGLNAHGVLVDELHAHESRALFDVLKTRTTSRRQPLIGVITTADYERPSICNEVYRWACQVRDGVVKAPSYLPVIYEASIEDDIQSPATWRKANPNLGISVREDTLAEESLRATRSPGYRDEFLRTHLNVRTNAKVSAINTARWAACRKAAGHGMASLSFQELRQALVGKRCFGGLDLASTTDLASLCLFFPEFRAALWWNWCPRDSAADREKRDRVSYVAWAEAGAITLTGDGPDERSVDYGTIRRDIVQVASEYDLQELAFDRYGANETVTALRDEHGIRILQFGQSFVSMGSPAKELDRMVNGRAELLHGGDPVAAWAASNLVWEVNRVGGWMPSKRKSTERIDPMVSLLMAIGAWMLQDLGEGSPQTPWASYVGGDGATPTEPAPSQEPVAADDPDGDAEQPAAGEADSERPARAAPPAAPPPLSAADRALQSWLMDDE